MSSPGAPPSHARRFHKITTPRLILRSAYVSDVRPFTLLRSDPLNNPFGGVKDPNLTIEQQTVNIEAQAHSNANGQNAWLVVILPDKSQNIPADLSVSDGLLIGNTGFNGFPLRPSLKDPSKHVLVGDMGFMLDHRFRRRGYALEALSAIFEYGFYELGVEQINLNPFKINEPFQGLMRALGLGETGKVFLAGDGSLGEQIAYRFEKEQWEEAKKELKESRKWPL